MHALSPKHLAVTSHGHIFGPDRPHISSRTPRWNMATLQDACHVILIGALAQLGERLICIQEVRSSILLGSTMFCGEPSSQNLSGGEFLAKHAKQLCCAAGCSLPVHRIGAVPSSRLAPLGTSLRVLPLEGHVSTCGRKQLVGR